MRKTTADAGGLGYGPLRCRLRNASSSVVKTSPDVYYSSQLTTAWVLKSYYIGYPLGNTTFWRIQVEIGTSTEGYYGSTASICVAGANITPDGDFTSEAATKYNLATSTIWDSTGYNVAGTRSFNPTIYYT